MRWTTTIIVAAALVAAACSSKKKPEKHQAAAAPPAPVQQQTRDEEFTAYANEVYDAWLKANPTSAAGMGYHQFDGVLPDYSPKALEARAAQLKEQKARLESFAGTLSSERDLERQVLLTDVRSTLFGTYELRQPQRNPMFYPVTLLDYISRDYAPIDQRARGLITLCNAAPAYFEQAMANLEEALPRTWIETALLQTRGAIQFAKEDVPPALKGASPEVAKKLGPALAKYEAALGKYADFLDERKAKQTEDFALGPEKFRAMLREEEGVDVDLDHLREIGEKDLARNLAALDQAAKQIDPNKTATQVVDMVRADRPEKDQLLALAGEQATAMRKFLVDHHIVSIPTDDVAEPRLSPPFERWNFAFMSAPGQFEKKKLPSFYYISPPDPKWSKKVQEEYIPSRYDLEFVTIHELWPGHFLHHLHIKVNPSKILRSFCTYSTSEGWAHYTEEMMWNAGVGNGDPKTHIGELQNALLRDVRFLVALGMHTRGMTVDEAKKMFIDKGFQDEGNAMQQAVRGTFDPGYLNYTLGKLMIRKLRDDWKAKVGDRYGLQAFHDEFLSHACAPIPVIRKQMLGPSAGPPL